MRIVYLQGCGFLLSLQIFSNPIGEPLAESTADLGEEGAVVVEKQCTDGDEDEDASDDPSRCCPPELAGFDKHDKGCVTSLLSPGSRLEYSRRPGELVIAQRETNATKG